MNLRQCPECKGTGKMQILIRCYTIPGGCEPLSSVWRADRGWVGVVQLAVQLLSFTDDKGAQFWNAREVAQLLAMKRILQIAATGLRLSLKTAQYLLAERPKRSQRPQHPKLRAIGIQAQPVKPRAIAPSQTHLVEPQAVAPSQTHLVEPQAVAPSQTHLVEPQAVAPSQRQTIAALPAKVPNSTERQALVRGLLDEAWAQGMRTYPQLIGYVQEQTGTACGRRMVAAWKKDRKLTDASTAA